MSNQHDGKDNHRIDRIAHESRYDGSYYENQSHRAFKMQKEFNHHGASNFFDNFIESKGTQSPLGFIA
jgi:hypothetical protein